MFLSLVNLHEMTNKYHYTHYLIDKLEIMYPPCILMLLKLSLQTIVGTQVLSFLEET